MAQQTIQIADKSTLDEVNSKLSAMTYCTLDNYKCIKSISVKASPNTEFTEIVNITGSGVLYGMKIIFGNVSNTHPCSVPGGTQVIIDGETIINIDTTSKYTTSYTLDFTLNCIDFIHSNAASGDAAIGIKPIGEISELPINITQTTVKKSVYLERPMAFNSLQILVKGAIGDEDGVRAIVLYKLLD